MKKTLIIASVALAAASPIFAQESLFVVEAPGVPAKLSPLATTDTRTAQFQTAWSAFQDAFMGVDSSALKNMLAGASGTAGSDASIDKTIEFLLRDAQSPFTRSRMFLSISSKTYPRQSVVLGWEAPASLSAQDQAQILGRAGGEAIGCVCVGPDCTGAPPATAREADNAAERKFACVRMLLAPDKTVRYEVDMPQK
jgi:hypothetical protein